MHEQDPSDRRPRAKLAAELGAAGLGLAAAGYLAYRHQWHAESSALPDPLYAARYEKQLAIIGDSRVENTLPHGREVLGAIAVHVYYASFASTEQAITQDQLHGELDRSANDHLYLYTYQLKRALGYLRDNELIGRRPQVEHRHVQGYYALPALVWGMEQTETMPAELAAAQAEFLAEHRQR